MPDLNDQTPLLRRYLSIHWIFYWRGGRRGFCLGMIVASLLFWLASFFV